MTAHSSFASHDDRSSQRPRSWTGVVVHSFISVALITISVVIFFVVGRGRVPQQQGLATASAAVVEAIPIEDHTGGIDFDVDGVVIPFREIEIPAEVAGRIDWKSENCRVGHTVTGGELLVRIAREDYDLEVRQIQENVKQARANVHELDVEIITRQRQIELAQEDLSIKRREVDRYEKIDDPGVYSKSELDTARLKELQARDALQTEEDQLELSEARRTRLDAAIDLGLAQLEKAELELTRTDIHAPIDGVITREGPEQGGYVQRGGMVAVVQDSSSMEIRCSLPMHQMNWLWQSERGAGDLVPTNNAYELPETPATVEFDLGTARCKWQGSLAYFDGAQVDQQTRMVPCRVVVKNPREMTFEGEVTAAAKSAPITLMTGMFVKVRVHARPGVALLAFPRRRYNRAIECGL